MLQAEQGYGFIRIHPDVCDFYFHKSDLTGEVRDGDEVEFWLDDGRRGDLVAVEVERLKNGTERPGLSS